MQVVPTFMGKNNETYMGKIYVQVLQPLQQPCRANTCPGVTHVTTVALNTVTNYDCLVQSRRVDAAL